MMDPASQPLLIVPDTNVCVSGATLSAKPPSQIMQAWASNRLDFALCQPILDEIREVLSRPYFKARVGWTAERISEYVEQMREGSAIMPVTTPVDVASDPDDNVLFSCAVEAGANYIVSYDKHVRRVGEFQGIKTIHPFDFVQAELQQKTAA